MDAAGAGGEAARGTVAVAGAAGAGGVSVSIRALALEGSGGGWISRWVRILAAYFSTQTLTQLAGIAAGLLFVNFMPVREFALYTLAFSVVNFFNFVTDLGST